jgi:uncharacterized membrane protein
MKKSSLPVTLLIIIISLIPLMYAASIYPGLPDTIPTHFGIDGKADGFGSRNTIWFTTLLLATLSVGTYFLIKYLPRIDPKKTAGQSPALYHKIAMAIVVFFCVINLTILHSTKSTSFDKGNLMLPVLGLFFTILGNYMHSIKPNYFVGFRTPWTLENEDNWRKTHRLVSKLWVPGGLLIAAGSLILPVKAGFILLFIVLAPMIIIPGVFSYLYFRKHRQ